VQAWVNFTNTVTQSNPPWLSTKQHVGTVAVTQAYSQVLGGRGDPRMGHILSLS
jgi:hypothetical protein